MGRVGPTCDAGVSTGGKRGAQLPREEPAPSWRDVASARGHRQTSRLEGLLTLNLWPPRCEGRSLRPWVTQRGHRPQQRWEAETLGLLERGPTPCLCPWERVGLTSRDVPLHSALAFRGPEAATCESSRHEPFGVQAPTGHTAPGLVPPLHRRGPCMLAPEAGGPRAGPASSSSGVQPPGSPRSRACPAWLCGCPISHPPRAGDCAPTPRPCPPRRSRAWKWEARLSLSC